MPSEDPYCRQKELLISPYKDDAFIKAFDVFCRASIVPTEELFTARESITKFTRYFSEPSFLEAATDLASAGEVAAIRDAVRSQLESLLSVYVISGQQMEIISKARKTKSEKECRSNLLHQIAQILKKHHASICEKLLGRHIASFPTLVKHHEKLRDAIANVATDSPAQESINQIDTACKLLTFSDALRINTQPASNSSDRRRPYWYYPNMPQGFEDLANALEKSESFTSTRKELNDLKPPLEPSKIRANNSKKRKSIVWWRLFIKYERDASGLFHLRTPEEVSTLLNEIKLSPEDRLFAKTFSKDRSRG